MKLSVIIVSFNTKELLKRCLESIAKARRREGEKEEVEIIVVDNASGDGSAEEIKKIQIKYQKYKLNIKYILNNENLGFAKANNQALLQAQGEYCLLLNSDTQVRSGSLEKLIEFAREHPDTGLIGVRLLNLDDSIQPSIYHLPTVWRAFREFWLGQKGAYEKYAVTGTSPVEVEAVTFAAALIPKTTIEKIGLLDERYFMYFEDLDYCRRVKRAGLTVYYLPTAEVVHCHGASGQGLLTTYQHLTESSKIYNGQLKYWLLTFIIWFGQKWRKIFGCF